MICVLHSINCLFLNKFQYVFIIVNNTKNHPQLFPFIKQPARDQALPILSHLILIIKVTNVRIFILQMQKSPGGKILTENALQRCLHFFFSNLFKGRHISWLLAISICLSALKTKHTAFPATPKLDQGPGQPKSRLRCQRITNAKTSLLHFHSDSSCNSFPTGKMQTHCPSLLEYTEPSNAVPVETFKTLLICAD